MAYFYDVAAYQHLDTTTFRVWINNFHNRVTGIGWVDTAATGSINLATVTYTGSAEFSSGFKVYRMDDTLQATAPFFMKVEFGTGTLVSGANYHGAVWITVGTTHDGAGTLGGVVSTRMKADGSAGSLSTTVDRQYTSGSNAKMIWASLMQGGSSGTRGSLIVSVERLTTSNADNGLGVKVVAGNNHILVPSTGTVPAAESNYPILLSRNNPQLHNNMVPVGFPSGFQGLEVEKTYLYGAVRSSDVGHNTVVSVDQNLGGSAVNYINTGLTLLVAGVTTNHLLVKNS